jgi:hypothetical protein
MRPNDGIFSSFSLPSKYFFIPANIDFCIENIFLPSKLFLAYEICLIKIQAQNNKQNAKKFKTRGIMVENPGFQPF